MGAEFPTLEKINTPADLRGLSDKELDALSSEIRKFLIENVTKTGGHLASNLGVVELTIALHRVIDTPKDHIIWDVGHQSYVHKLLTGRKDCFSQLRQGGGLSGFTNRDESEHDCFGAGHSSTSLSAALGFAEADKLSGSDAYTVAVVGDGAFTGGMIHEALNNCAHDLHLIIIINENEMSISKNTGQFANNMARLRAGHGYLKTKKVTRNIIKHIPFIGGWLFRRIRDAKKLLKNMIYGSNYFEDLGLNYFGPIDGHDRSALERLLKEAKEIGQSSVIHIKTVKGRGYEPAETDPGYYHGLAPMSTCATSLSFSKLMGNRLTELADNNDRICAITAAMADGTGLVPFSNAHPDRFFDVGIAEEHALTFAAGLAAEGMRPVVCIYSTFLQRGYDNIIHDIALQRLPVVICVDRAGLNATDGPTHHGIFDVSFLSSIPNITVYTPITEKALRIALDEALALDSPCVIRYPNGCEQREIADAFYGKDEPVHSGARRSFAKDACPKTVVITHGRIASEALIAAKKLKQKKHPSGVVLLEKLKPYEKTAKEVAALLPESVKNIVFLEEELRNGGMGMLLSDAMTRLGLMKNKRFVIMANDDSFAVRETNEPILKTVGLTADDIVNEALKLCDK